MQTRRLDACNKTYYTSVFRYPTLFRRVPLFFPPFSLTTFLAFVLLEYVQYHFIVMGVHYSYVRQIQGCVLGVGWGVCVCGVARDVWAVGQCGWGAGCGVERGLVWCCILPSRHFATSLKEWSPNCNLIQF